MKVRWIILGALSLLVGLAIARPHVGTAQGPTVIINLCSKLANFYGAGSAQVWQLTSANSITRLNDITFSGSSFNVSAPAQSVTLLVIATAAPTPTPTPTPAATDPTVWSLAWSDEFDGATNSPIDSSKWTAEVGGNGGKPGTGVLHESHR